MTNKQTPVEWFINELMYNSENNSYEIHPGDLDVCTNKAKAMEAEREAKYQKMLEMLKYLYDSDLIKNDQADRKVEQLIKEVE